MISRIVSGGQTGADRAALDAAIENGIPHGGWCPAGRVAEDGIIPARYQLRETPDSEYSQRTEWNVRDSDATVIVTRDSGEMEGGTLLTHQLARRLGKPFIRLDGGQVKDSACESRAFIERHRVEILNVAGPRESEQKGIHQAVKGLMQAVLGRGGDD